VADDVQITAGSGTTIATDDLGSGRQVQRVKVGYGVDGSYADATPAAGLPVAAGSTALSGSASALNADLIASTDVSGYQMLSVILSGTFSAFVRVQGSNDNTNWVDLNLQQISTGTIGPASSSFISSGGSLFVACVPTQYIRVRATSYTSGTVSANVRLYNGAHAGLTPSILNVSATGSAVFSDNGGVNTWTGVAAVGAAYNGSLFDRWRNNVNTTTGDSGAKTANFLGATQTNYNARGAYITLMVGATSGTFTTFQTGLQFSPDGGTTWLPLTDVGANLTTPASGNTIVWHIYPDASSTVPAASGGISAATQYNHVSLALPRTWRFAITLAGTSPSLTVTAVNINYIV
jgi:hypothetical protein